jgi:hypothetical protein
MNPGLTSRLEQLVRSVLSVAQDVGDQALASTSVEARSEWRELLGRLPTEDDLCRGVIAFGEDDLQQILAKAIRFRAIVGGLTANASRVAETRVRRRPC